MIYLYIKNSLCLYSFVNFAIVLMVSKKKKKKMREKTLRFEMIVIAQEDVRKWRWGIRDNLVFKIIYIKGILGVLVKISLNKISITPIPPNFGRNENWDLEEIRRNEYFISFPSLKLPNERMIFSFLLIPSYLGSVWPPLSLKKCALFAENANICVFGPTIFERLRFKKRLKMTF